MIYKSFFKKKVTKIYLWIFILFSLVFSFLFVAKEYMIIRGNEAYKNSFLYFVSEKDLDLSSEKNIQNYNKALYVACHSDLTDVFVVKDNPIIHSDSFEQVECSIDDITIFFHVMDRINIVANEQLYDLLDSEQSEYYYFIRLKNWFAMKDTYQDLVDTYHVDVIVEDMKIDDVDYKNVIYIFDIFIKVMAILFVGLFILSIINVVIDEKKNNRLYYSLGYSKIKIFQMTIYKIILLFIIPVCILFLFLCIYKIFI